jgi:hypothetical protein
MPPSILASSPAVFPRQVEIAAVRSYFAALRRAQADIDVMHALHTISCQ